MPSISPKERQQINHKLKKLGFGGLDDPNIFAQIAVLYRTHDSFRGLLMSTAPDQRRIAYEALKPHLLFAAKPLDVYEREIKEKAEREQWDVWDGSVYPKPFKVGEVESEEYKLQKLASEAIQQAQHEKAGGKLELVCLKCTAQQFFPAKTRKEAERLAQSDGWRWEESNGTMKVYCRQHVPTHGSVILTCIKCARREEIHAWDQRDAYRDAERLGWRVSADDSLCPRCLFSPNLIQ